MAVPNSFYQQFLNDLAEQMALYPSPMDNPMLRQRMAKRYQPLPMGENAAQKAGREEDGSFLLPGGMVRPAAGGALRPPIGRPDSDGGILGALGAYLQHPRQHSPLRNTDMIKQLVDPRPFLEGAKWSVTHPVQRLTDPEMNNRMEFPLGKGTGHGAEIKAELLAKRAAKGPRKPGGGRRPAGKTKYPPESNQDLVEMLAKSIPEAAVPMHKARGGGLKAMLGRLRKIER